MADIIDTALDAGAAVALLGATCSAPEEEALSAAAFALGARRCAPMTPRFVRLVVTQLGRDNNEDGQGCRIYLGHGLLSIAATYLSQARRRIMSHGRLGACSNCDRASLHAVTKPPLVSIALMTHATSRLATAAQCLCWCFVQHAY